MEVEQQQSTIAPKGMYHAEPSLANKCEALESQLSHEKSQKDNAVAALLQLNCKAAPSEHDQESNSQDHLPKISGMRSESETYNCKYCDQVFHQLSKLKVHLLNHTGEKAFECKECGKLFTTFSNLKQHTQIHEKIDGRSRFDCKFCNKNYLYRSSLKKHLKKHQNNEQNPEDSADEEAAEPALKKQAKTETSKLEKPKEQSIAENPIRKDQISIETKSEEPQPATIWAESFNESRKQYPQPSEMPSTQMISNLMDTKLMLFQEYLALGERMGFFQKGFRNTAFPGYVPGPMSVFDYHQNLQLIRLYENHYIPPTVTLQLGSMPKQL